MAIILSESDVREIKDYLLSLSSNVSIEGARSNLLLCLEVLRDEIVSKPNPHDHTYQSIISQIYFRANSALGLNSGFGLKCEEPSDDIIDVQSQIILCRSIYEMYCLVRLLYVLPDSSDWRSLAFSLWKLSGLRYRLRLYSSRSKIAQKEKYDEELQECSRLSRLIYSNLIYNLNEYNKSAIDSLIKRKDFKFTIIESRVAKLTWHEMEGYFNFIPAKNPLISFYNYYSQNAHPSYTSVFQFQQMYTPPEYGFKSICTFNVSFLSYLLACLISDHFKLIVGSDGAFETLPLKHIVFVNFINNLFRGDESVVGDEFGRIVSQIG